MLGTCRRASGTAKFEFHEFFKGNLTTMDYTDSGIEERIKILPSHRRARTGISKTRSGYVSQQSVAAASHHNF
jgi:hypothetical protein